MLSRNQVLQQGRYHIISQFEHKEIGISYKAFDNVLKKDVIINETSSDINDLATQFKVPVAKQLENLTSIKHESFTQVHGFFSELDQQYLVTEAVEGESLREFLEKNSSPDFSTILSWTEQIVEALSYLHSKNPPLIHCDLTPSNLILTKENKINLLTYSLISDLYSQQNRRQEKQFSETKLPYLPLETLWTTLDYASQKVILNSYDEKSAEILASPADERTDIYSLGATIYHLVTEKCPTSALERSIEVLEGKEDPLVSPHIINPRVPQNISAFLLKALEIKRENRFESVSAMFKAWQLITSKIKKISEIDITEEALNRVELARQTLRKQREEEQLNNSRNNLDLKEENLQREEKLPEKLKQPQFNEKVPETKIRKLNESILVAEAVEPKKHISVPIPTTSVDSSTNLNLVSTKKENDKDLFVFSDEPSRKSSMWLIPVVCGVLILSVAGFFGYRFLNESSQINTVQPTAEQTSGETKNPTEIIANPPNTVVTQSESAIDNSVTSDSNSQKETDSNLQSEDNTTALETQKTNESISKAKKNNTLVSPTDKKTPAAVKTPVSEKKKVTVDDIINDN